METDRPSESAPPTDKEKKEGRDSITIEDLTLPKSIITRLAKGVLPPNTQIQTNAVLAMSKSATVFINHLANAANEHTKNASKKTIMPNDVFDALEDIEFPFLREALEAEFKKFNEVQTTKRNTYRRKVAAAKAGKAVPEADAGAAAKPTSATPTSKNASSGSGGDPNASILSTTTTTAATSEPASGATPRSKKQKTNNNSNSNSGPTDDSQMDVDGNPHDAEERDPSDADTEPEQEHDEDDDDDEDEDQQEEEEEDDEDEQDEDPNDHIMRDAMEEKDDDEERDEALDNGADSD
ncbi:putative histone-like transcription factor and archaeal histone protein [Eutypa lata UCREL1]|uniref:DNA polymerase epsilon subunit D n=1 Tax=Eutypa lata (strain UCR-EL1) TaxID=1287681 RepID=M7S720_EUTLA|nr:putative histone-like transcription factor and archaeal histone protein [Eutypa lata UCREL1]